MTENEWLTWGGISDGMLELLRAKPGLGRKRRLLAVGCCQRILKWMPEECLPAIELAEKLADGLADEDARRAAFDAAGEAKDHQSDLRKSWAGYCAYRAVAGPASYDRPESWNEDAAAWVAQVAAQPDAWITGRWDNGALSAQRGAITELIRDIFGNPFRPVSLDSSWLTSAVVAIARGVYEERAFDRMPILADALQDAGCDNEEVLNHCRSDGVHVRGCWVVDLLLGKE
jgi:hypothetical protein